MYVTKKVSNVKVHTEYAIIYWTDINSVSDYYVTLISQFNVLVEF